MPRGDRRRTFATALGGAIAATSIIFTVWAYRHVSEYQDEQAQERQSASDDYRREAEQRISFCLDTIPEERLTERLRCLSDAIDAAEDSATAKYDLKAQQDMSAWALAVLYVSIAALIATVIGVIFVWRTLREARTTTRAAIRSTVQSRLAVGQARETNRIALKTAFEQNRAWIQVECRLEEQPRIEDGYFTYKVWIEPKNVGRVPAKDFFLHFDHDDMEMNAAQTNSRLSALVAELNSMALVGETIFPNQKRGEQLRPVKIKVEGKNAISAQIFVCARYVSDGGPGYLNTAESYRLVRTDTGPPTGQIDLAGDVSAMKFRLVRKLSGFIT
jgi:hypothetical protein